MTAVKGVGYTPHFVPTIVPPPGPPFAANSADNGLSVDPVTGHIVLGNHVGGITATLLSDRQIPLNLHGIDLLGTNMRFTINDGGLFPTIFFGDAAGVNIFQMVPSLSIAFLNATDGINLGSLSLSGQAAPFAILAASDLAGGSSVQVNKNSVDLNCSPTLNVQSPVTFGHVITANTVNLQATFGDVDGIGSNTRLTVDDIAQLVNVVANNGFQVTGDGFLPGVHIVSTGATANSFANLNLLNDVGSVGELFLTASTYTASAFIGSDALGFFNNGVGGIALVSANVAGTVRFAVGGGGIPNTLLTLKPGAPGTVNINGLQNFPNNAAALGGGLVIGDLYRTAGAVMVVI